MTNYVAVDLGNQTKHCCVHETELFCEHVVASSITELY